MFGYLCMVHIGCRPTWVVQPNGAKQLDAIEATYQKLLLSARRKSTGAAPEYCGTNLVVTGAFMNENPWAAAREKWNSDRLAAGINAFGRGSVDAELANAEIDHGCDWSA
jgi:hypothetical protein